MALRWQVAQVGGPTRGAISSQRVWSERHGLLLGLFDGGLLLGVGEASPLPGYSPDNLVDAARALRALRPPSGLPLTTHAIAAWCTESALESPSARFAVETALLDAAARQQSLAVGSLLGQRRAVQRSVLVGHLSDPNRVQLAIESTARGARCLKFKASGEDPGTEAAQIVEVRRNLGAAVRIRLDLNGALDVDGARRALDHYARAEVELVEEPTRGAELLQLGACAVPWHVDESLAQPELRSALLAGSAASGFVLKPTLLGGVMQCLAFATQALDSGRQVIITHAFEGPVALAACCELALALGPHADTAHGLDLHPPLSAFPAAHIAQLPQSASTDAPLRIEAADGTGLGIDLPEQAWAPQI